MKIEIYKSGFTQRWVVLIDGVFKDSFNTEEEAISYTKNGEI